MKVIGVTGSFGSGKTSVASIFWSLGAKVYDADRIAHRVIKKGNPAYREVVDAFGKEILRKDGEVNRKALAKKVFGDKAALKRLNAIVHPEVIGELKAAIRRAGPEDVVVIDAPLLVEAGLSGMVDKIVVVKSSKKIQVERSRRKFNMKEEDVLRRIKNQIPMGEKLKLADFVVDNNGKMSETKKQVIEIWRNAWR